MLETEPLYFKEFRVHIDKKFEKIDERFESIDRKFERIDKRFDAIETELNDLVISTATGFRNVDCRFDELENIVAGMQDSIKKIEDYEPRIISLERVAFS